MSKSQTVESLKLLTPCAAAVLLSVLFYSAGNCSSLLPQVGTVGKSFTTSFVPDSGLDPGFSL